MALSPARSYASWVLAPVTNRPVVTMTEAPSPDFFWRELRTFRDVPKHGRTLFSGTFSERNSLWREFASYLRQAETYFQAANQVAGSSAALPYYYSMMNLAKAELLISNPSAIVGTTIRHGLSFSPATSKSLPGDEVVVQEGVFPLLYEARTGHRLPAGTRLSVKRLLANCANIGWELQRMGYPCEVSPALHAIAVDDNSAWSVLALHDRGLLSSAASAKLLRRAFDEIQEPPNPKSFFAVSTRFGWVGRYFQGKTLKPVRRLTEPHPSVQAL